MKIVDLQVADVKYGIENELTSEVRRLKYPQKYLLLCIGNEVVSLEIENVTDTAFYLRINDEALL